MAEWCEDSSTCSDWSGVVHQVAVPNGIGRLEVRADAESGEEIRSQWPSTATAVIKKWWREILYGNYVLL
jgi:hypothetical protein